MINEFITQIDTFYNQLKDYQKVMNADGKLNNYLNLAKLIAFVISIGILVTIILFLLLMLCSMKNCCHQFSSLFQALLSILKMILAIIINVVALVTLISAIALSSGCYIADKSFNDPTFTDRFLEQSMKDLLNSCVFPSADGSVKGFVKDIDRFDKITDMTKTFGEDFNTKYLPTLDAQKNSISIKEYNAYILDKLVTGKVSDYRSRSSEDPLALMDA